MRQKATITESYYQAWKRVLGYFKEHLETGDYSWPSEAKDGVRVVVVWNQ
jgi:hypothetical protein